MVERMQTVLDGLASGLSAGLQVGGFVLAAVLCIFVLVVVGNWLFDDRRP